MLRMEKDKIQLQKQKSIMKARNYMAKKLRVDRHSISEVFSVDLDVMKGKDSQNN